LHDPETGNELPEGKLVRTGGMRGPVGSGDRRMALDQLDEFGRPRRLLVTPQAPGGESRGFTERFPDADKIRVL
jgi:hypothetical protein